MTIQEKIQRAIIIRELYKRGLSFRKISRVVGVSHATVDFIIKGTGLKYAKQFKNMAKEVKTND